MCVHAGKTELSRRRGCNSLAPFLIAYAMHRHTQPYILTVFWHLRQFGMDHVCQFYLSLSSPSFSVSLHHLACSAVSMALVLLSSVLHQMLLSLSLITGLILSDLAQPNWGCRKLITPDYRGPCGLRGRLRDVCRTEVVGDV